MRGLVITINGQSTVAPYKQETISFYQERNNLLRGTRNEEREVATIRNATAEEVKQYLIADEVPTQTPLQQGSSSDIDLLKNMILSQQRDIAALTAQLQKSTPAEQPETTKPQVQEKPAAPDTSKKAEKKADKSETGMKTGDLAAGSLDPIKDDLDDLAGNKDLQII